MADKQAVVERAAYGSVEEMLADGAADVEYAWIEGLKPGGKEIRIGSVSAEDWMVWIESNDGPAKRTAGLRLIIKSLVDDDGKRIGSDKDLATLKQVRHSVTERILREIIKLNGINVKKDGTSEAENDAKKD
jgi:hypothetical protein